MLFDMNGRQLMRITTNNTTEIFNVSYLPSGVYLIVTKQSKAKLIITK